MKKIMQFFLIGIVSVPCGSLFGFPKDMTFDHLKLHCNILAQSMIDSCDNDAKKIDLINAFNKVGNDDEFLSSVVSDENWPIYKNAFLSLFPVLIIGAKYCLNDEAVTRFQSEKIDLLKAIINLSEDTDSVCINDVDDIACCFSYFARMFYEGNINTLLKTDGEKQGTVIDYLDCIISKKTGEYRISSEQLRDTLIEFGAKRLEEIRSETAI
jgi:hypothetical protein